ncbi:MAG: hypothetical protein C4321_09965, partial [Chloroflexota bacterium]
LLAVAGEEGADASSGGVFGGEDGEEGGEDDAYRPGGEDRRDVGFGFHGFPEASGLRSGSL